MTSRITSVIAALIVGAAALPLLGNSVTARVAAAPPAAQAITGGKVEISGHALGFGTIGAGSIEQIQIRIDKWSSPADRDKLIATFLEKKQDGLLKLLRDMPEIGRWRFPGYRGPDPDKIYGLGTPIKYAANQPLQPTPGGGRRVVMITDRVIGYREQVDKPRQYDYPFTLMEMHFTKDNKGEGKMAWFTQIDFDKEKKSIELQYYSSEPVSLNELIMEPRK